MPLLPPAIMTYLAAFAPPFSSRVWRHVPPLVAGAILAPGHWMVSSGLRVVGLSPMRSLQTSHRVLNRAKWSSLGASRILLRLLLAVIAPPGPLVCGLDETIERRRGTKIAAAGIYRDPVRSSHRHFIKVNGLRWICLMLLVPIPWAARVGALPFLTVLAPSERYRQERGRQHKPISRLRPPNDLFAPSLVSLPPTRHCWRPRLCSPRVARSHPPPGHPGHAVAP